MNKLFYKSALLLLSSIGLLFTSCTRDDVGGYSSVDISNYPITFTVQAQNLATKSGDTLVCRTKKVLSSEYLGSKNGEDLYLTAIEEDWPIELTDTISSAPSTKGSVTTTANIINNDIAVILYSHTDGADVSNWQLHTNGEGSRDGVMRARYSQQAQKWLITDGGELFWPNTGNKKAHFFAYAPYLSSSAPNQKIFPSVISANYPKIKLRQGQFHNGQVDLVVSDMAVPDNPTFDKVSQKLIFTHALTGIRFMVEKGLNLISISIDGVELTGVLNLATNSWTYYEDTDTGFLISEAAEGGSGNLIKKSETDDYSLLDDKYTIFALPSDNLPNGVLQDGAKLIFLTDDFKHVTHSIAGHQWKQGKMITYKISKKPEELVVGDDLYTFQIVHPNGMITLPSPISSLEPQTATGSYDKATVLSYRTKAADATNEPVEWYVEGIYSTKTAAQDKDKSREVELDPNTMSGIIGGTFTSESSANKYPEKNRMTLPLNIEYNQTSSISRYSQDRTNRNVTLKYNDFKGEIDDPYDLATRGKLSETKPTKFEDLTYASNTYIVNGPGYYCFPLVMGNPADKVPLSARDYKGYRLINRPMELEAQGTASMDDVKDFFLNKMFPNNLFQLTRGLYRDPKELPLQAMLQDVVRYSANVPTYANVEDATHDFIKITKQPSDFPVIVNPVADPIYWTTYSGRGNKLPATDLWREYNTSVSVKFGVTQGPVIKMGDVYHNPIYSFIDFKGWEDIGIYWATFYIPEDACTSSGLAKIVVRDQDKTPMWTYLIWLTDYSPTTTLSNSAFPNPGTGIGVITDREEDVKIKRVVIDGRPTDPTIAGRDYYMVAARDLGHVDAQDALREVAYLKRTSFLNFIRLEQVGSGNYCILPVGIEYDDITLSYNLEGDISPYWKYGSPIPHFNGKFGFRREGQAPVNEEEEWDFIYEDSHRVEIPEILCNPSSPRLELKETQSVGFWDDDEKTIYDPCPPGYRIPKSGTFNVFMREPLGQIDNNGSSYYTGTKNAEPSPAGYFLVNYYAEQYGYGSQTISFPYVGEEVRYHYSECADLLGQRYYFIHYQNQDLVVPYSRVNTYNKSGGTRAKIRPVFKYMVSK